MNNGNKTQPRYLNASCKRGRKNNTQVLYIARDMQSTLQRNPGSEVIITLGTILDKLPKPVVTLATVNLVLSSYYMQQISEVMQERLNDGNRCHMLSPLWTLPSWRRDREEPGITRHSSLLLCKNLTEWKVSLNNTMITKQSIHFESNEFEAEYNKVFSTNHATSKIANSIRFDLYCFHWVCIWAIHIWCTFSQTTFWGILIGLNCIIIQVTPLVLNHENVLTGLTSATRELL